MPGNHLIDMIYESEGWVVKKTRPFYKTLYYKFLIKFKGKFKDRFWRCKECNQVIDKYYDTTIYVHSIRCQCLKSFRDKLGITLENSSLKNKPYVIELSGVH